MKFILLFLGMILSILQDNNPPSNSELDRILGLKDDTSKMVQLDNYINKVIYNDPVQSKWLVYKQMDLSKKLKNDYWSGIAWFNIGFINARDALDSLSIENFETAIKHFEKVDAKENIIRCYVNIAALNGRLGKLEKEIELQQKIIKMLEGSNKSNHILNAYNSMGALYYNLEEIEKGLIYFKKARDLAIIRKDTSNLITANLGFTNCYAALKRFPDGLKHAQAALTLAQKYGAHFEYSLAHNAFTQLYQEWKKPDELIYHGQQIIYHASKLNETQYLLIGNLAVADGYRLKQDPENAIQYYSNAEKIAVKSGTVLQLDDIYKGLSTAYTHANDYKSALYYYRKYASLSDSTLNEKTKREANEMHIKYETAQKEKELSIQKLNLAEQEVTIQKNRQYFFISITTAIIFLMLLIFALFFIYNKRKQFALRAMAIEKDKEVQQLQAFMEGEEKERIRIAKELHDGVAGMLTASKMQFQSFKTCKDYTCNLENYQLGLQLLTDATDEIRKTSHNLMPDIVLQKGLVEAVRKYCNKINSDSMEVQFDSWGDIGRFDERFEIAVYRMIQELLNNAMKHAEATVVLVQINKHEDCIFLTVEDNGKGINFDSMDQEGVGLQRFQQQAAAMNGKLEYENRPGKGLSVYLEFNINNQQI